MRVIHYAREVNLAGGTGSVVHYLMQEMQKAGVDVHVRTTRWGRWLQENRPRNVLLRKLFLAFEVGLYGLESLFFREPDGAVTINHGDALRGDMLVFHSCHRSLIREQLKSGNLRPLLDPVNWIIAVRERLRQLLYMPRYIVAVSAQALDDVRDAYSYVSALPGRAIANGVDVDRFTNTSNPDDLRVREYLGISASEFVLVTVANRFRVKGIDTSIEALALLPNTVHLVVVGGDDKRPYLALARRLGVSSRVHFVGHATPDSYYRNANAFLLPTRFEAFGIVGVEALASGLPILMTAVGGIPTYLEHGVNGFFVESPIDVAARVQQLMADDDLRERMGEAAKISVENHTWSARAGEYIEAVRDVILLKSDKEAA